LITLKGLVGSLDSSIYILKSLREVLWPSVGILKRHGW
jgi:hypothetical protein